MVKNNKKKDSNKRKTKPKLSKWLQLPSYNSFDSFDYANEEIEEDIRENEKQSESYVSNLLKGHRLRNIEEEPSEEIIDISKFCDEVKEGIPYIQMRLDAEKINDDFELNVQKRIAKQVKIREATPKDLFLLVDLYNKSFLTATDPYRPLTLEEMKKVFNHNESIILIAEIWGENAGFIILDFEYKKKENNNSTYDIIGIIAGLGTLPEWQKRGIGTTLGVASWYYFKKRGVSELRCEVYARNLPSYKLIKGLGFEEYDVKFY